MLTILQGDDTAANLKTIRLKLPDTDIGSGFRIGFIFQGITKSGDYTPGGTLDFDYTREQTAAFPLGVSYGKTYLERNGLRQYISTTIPVCVTDSVERVAMATNDMNLHVTVNTGVPHVDKEALTKASTNADLRELANALLAAINAAEN